MATAAYGALAYLAWSHLRTGRVRLLLAVATAVLVVWICFGRLYLGVHYLSDGLAGVAGGAFCVGRGLACKRF
jgi:membrane-associated phospholipid phosphatase